MHAHFYALSTDTIINCQCLMGEIMIDYLLMILQLRMMKSGEIFKIKFSHAVRVSNLILIIEVKVTVFRSQTFKHIFLALHLTYRGDFYFM